MTVCSILSAIHKYKGKHQTAQEPHLAEQLLSAYQPGPRRNNPTVHLQACFRRLPAFAMDLPLHFRSVFCRTCNTCVELVVELAVFYQGVVELVHLSKISFCNLYSI